MMKMTMMMMKISLQLFLVVVQEGKSQQFPKVLKQNQDYQQLKANYPNSNKENMDLNLNHQKLLKKLFLE